MARDHPGKVFATINYGWESQEFYTRWMHGDAKAAAGMRGASLEPFGPQSPYASALLRYCVELLLADPAYVARLQRHYRMVKDVVGAGSEPKRAAKLKPKKRR